MLCVFSITKPLCEADLTSAFEGIVERDNTVARADENSRFFIYADDRKIIVETSTQIVQIQA